MTFKFPFSRFEVRDKSMEPVYFEGDRVLTFNWGKLRNKDVVVFVDSQANSSFWGVKRLQNQVSKRFWMHSLWSFTRMTSKRKSVYLIKRVNKIQGGQVFVSGDNKYMTAKIGPIKCDQIIGIVIWKY